MKVYRIYKEEKNFDQKKINRNDMIENVVQNFSIVIFDLNHSESDNLQKYYHKKINQTGLEIVYDNSQIDLLDGQLNYDWEIKLYFDSTDPTIDQLIDQIHEMKIFSDFGNDRDKIIVKFRNKKKTLMTIFDYDRTSELNEISTLHLVSYINILEPTNDSKLYVSYSNVDFKVLRDH